MEFHAPILAFVLLLIPLGSALDFAFQFLFPPVDCVLGFNHFLSHS